MCYLFLMIIWASYFCNCFAIINKAEVDVNTLHTLNFSVECPRLLIINQIINRAYYNKVRYLFDTLVPVNTVKRFKKPYNIKEYPEERPIVVVIASYNNEQWLQKNLDSVFMQKYHNYRVIYTDDCSTDATFTLVKAYIRNNGVNHKVTIKHNKQKIGALANQYNAIHSCLDNEIVVILDGDDWLAHENVFTYLNKVYADPNVWITYGQFQGHPNGEVGFCCMMPDDVINNNSYRDFGHIPSHLRSFYAGLFKRIKKEDLCVDDTFYPMTGDIAAMFPMMEMAGGRFKFISDVLYVYNTLNPISDHHVSKILQRLLDLYLRGKKRYERISGELF